MDKDFYSERNTIIDLLLSTNMSKTDIAKDLDITIGELNKRIKSYGLDWVKAKKRKMSRGQTALVGILQKILPHEQIELEYHVGERLLLDIYLPSYKLGIEYHGRQHFHYVAFFHKTEEEFKRARERDRRKAELCAEQGITLAVFRYNDDLTEGTVFDRLLNEIRTQPLQHSELCESDDEIEAKRRKRDLAERIKRSRRPHQKEARKKRTNDEESKRQREAFKKKVREDREEFRRKARLSIYEDQW